MIKSVNAWSTPGQNSYERWSVGYRAIVYRNQVFFYNLRANVKLFVKSALIKSQMIAVNEFVSEWFCLSSFVMSWFMNSWIRDMNVVGDMFSSWILKAIRLPLKVYHKSAIIVLRRWAIALPVHTWTSKCGTTDVNLQWSLLVDFCELRIAYILL